MAATAFSAVSWSPSEPITDSKMQQFSDNVQWVFDNTPRALYTDHSGFQKASGIKFLGGKCHFPQNLSTDRAGAAVYFGNMFSYSCRPIVTLGMNNSFQTKVFARFQGLSGTIDSDYFGIQIIIEVDATNSARDKIEADFLVHWIAMGW